MVLLDKCDEDVLRFEAEQAQGPLYVPYWERFGLWLDRFRELYPEDERSDLELIDIYE